MPSATFTGTSERTYPQYLDVDPIPGGTTLVADPQGVYELATADNWQIGTPPGDGLWTGSPPPPPMLGAFNAIPGQAVAGNSPPGNPGPGGGLGDGAVLGVALGAAFDGALGGALSTATSVTATFLGTSPRTYTQYLDLDAAGTTLVAEPLFIYDLTVADQWQIGMPPGDGLWEENSGPVVGTGFNAIPGRAVIGDCSPGYSGASGGPEEDDAVLGTSLGAALFVAVPVAAVYRGTIARTYTQYLNVGAAGITLVAEPGLTYDLTLADAWQLGLPPQDGWWGAVAQASPDFTIVPGLGVVGGMTPGFPGGILGPPPDRSALSFGATIGLAVIGGMNPGFPGFPGGDEAMGAALEDPFREHAAGPAVRVVRGRARKLPPPPRRRGSRRSRHAMAGRAGGR